jgi:hypothetical protein
VCARSAKWRFSPNSSCRQENAGGSSGWEGRDVAGGEAEAMPTGHALGA